MRVANSGVIDEKKGSFFKMDQKKKQVTLLEPDNKEARGETTGLDGKEAPTLPAALTFKTAPPGRGLGHPSRCRGPWPPPSPSRPAAPWP